MNSNQQQTSDVNGGILEWLGQQFGLPVLMVDKQIRLLGCTQRMLQLLQLAGYKSPKLIYGDFLPTELNLLSEQMALCLISQQSHFVHLHFTSKTTTTKTTQTTKTKSTLTQPQKLHLSLSPYQFKELQICLAYAHENFNSSRGERRLLDIIETLEQALITDELTGAYNRSFMQRHFETLLQQGQKNQQALSLIMFDFDFFKKINDEHGHIAGDQMLKHSIALLKFHLRQEDALIRYGGEEFIIILPRTEILRAAETAERMRNLLQSHPFYYDSSKITLSASFGVTEFNFQKDSAETLLKRADQALYLAKHQGRNRVVTDHSFQLNQIT
jgi:diguanylate cyclase (GGDEF)-like protein